MRVEVEDKGRMEKEGEESWEEEDEEEESKLNGRK